jgi:methyl-accepting chemotaxis protein
MVSNDGDGDGSMGFTNVWEAVVPDVIRRRFATKLLLALLAVVVLTVGFGTFVQAQTADDLRADANEQLTTTADIRAETLDTWLSGVKKQTQLTSAHPAVTSGDEQQVRDHLRGLVESESVPDGVIAVHYYDTEQREILVSSAEELEGVSPAEQGASFATNPPEFSGADDVYVSKPFSVPVVDHPVLTVISPVPGAEDRAIIYMIDLRERVGSLATVADGSIVVVDGDDQFVAHPNASLIGSEWTGADGVAASDSDGDGAASEMAQTTFSDRGDTLTAATSIDAADWTVVVRVPKSQAYALGEQVTSGILGLILLMMATLGVIGAVIGSDTVSSLRQISQRASRMAEGDLDVDLSTRREDEFATLVGTFTEMRDSLRDSLAEAESAREEAEAARSEAEAQAERLSQTAEEYEEVMRAVADGDLTRRVDADADDEAMRAIGEAFNDMLADIERTLADVKQFSEHVATAVETAESNVEDVTAANDDVTTSVAEIGDGAARQAENLQDVEGEMSQLSASAEEVASTVDNVAETSRQAATAGSQGRDRAEQALTEMEAIRAQTEETSAEIDALQSEVAEIGEIAEVITDIAEQTNLLALNASIEAARAGGDGNGAAEGFAVVADEVKSLAEETKESAEEVEDRIEGIQDRTSEAARGMSETSERVETGSETVGDAIDSLERIVGHVEEIDGDIQEIASATEQQARSSETVVEMVEEVAAISEQTSAEATEVDAATTRQTETLADVADAAGGLADRAERLRSLLSSFTVGESGSVTGDGRTEDITHTAGETDVPVAETGGDD